MAARRGLVIRAARTPLTARSQTAPSGRRPRRPWRLSMQMWCGIDWAERHHDVARDRRRRTAVAKARIGKTRPGSVSSWICSPHTATNAPTAIPVAIETAKGLLPAALRAAGFECFRSTRSPCPDTATGTRPAGQRVTPPTRSCWPTSCAPTRPITGRCPTTANSRSRSGSWPGPNRTRSGIASNREQAAIAAARVLPELPGLFRRPDQRGRAGSAARWRPHPQPHSALRRASLSAALRRGGRSRGLDAEAARILAATKPNSSASSRRRDSDGPSGRGIPARSGHRRQQRRGARACLGGGLRRTPRQADPDQLPRSRPRPCGPGARRDR